MAHLFQEEAEDVLHHAERILSLFAVSEDLQAEGFALRTAARELVESGHTAEQYQNLCELVESLSGLSGVLMANTREIGEHLDRAALRPDPPQAIVDLDPRTEGAPIAAMADPSAVVQTGYTTKQSLTSLWGGLSITTPTGNLQNVGQPSGGTRQMHREGFNGPGLNYQVRLPNGGARRVYAEWEVLFEEGFSFGNKLKGGKMGGLGIGDVVHGGNGTPERLAKGGSLRLTWHGHGDGEHPADEAHFRPYSYHRSQRSIYGDGEVTEHEVPVGEWIKIGMEVDVRKGVGIIEVNGKVISDWRYDWPGELKVTQFLAHNYHGGGSRDWGPVRDCWSQTRNAAIYIL